jgi:hypothetical protein
MAKVYHKSIEAFARLTQISNYSGLRIVVDTSGELRRDPRPSCYSPVDESADVGTLRDLGMVGEENRGRVCRIQDCRLPGPTASAVEAARR